MKQKFQIRGTKEGEILEILLVLEGAEMTGLSLVRFVEEVGDNEKQSSIRNS